jgi:hypothetical protein
MVLVRDEPLPSLFAQSYGHAYCGAGDSTRAWQYPTDSLATIRNAVTSKDPGPPGL